MSDRPGTPPHNVDAEVAVLGAILLHGKDTLVEVQARLTPEDFYVPAHQSLFKAMIALESRGEPIDVITLHHQLKAIGEDRMVGEDLLAKLSDRYATAHNVDSHARIVADLSRLRRFIQTARELVGRANTEIEDVRGFLDEAEQKVLEVKSNVSDAALRPVGEVVFEVVRNLERRIKSKNPITGVPTGFVKLDELTAGLQPKDLVIIAARPSMGKTAFALNVTQNVSITAQRHMKLPDEERPARHPVLFFSLEMGAEQLIERILAAEAKIDYSDLRRGRMMGDDVQRIVRAVDRVRTSPIWIDDRSSPSIVEIRSVARRWRNDRSVFKNPDDLGIIVIDYLQLCRGAARNYQTRESEIAEISRGLKALAKELAVPVVALAQVSRAAENRTGGRPMLSDLRESGAIEQDADVIFFLHREERYLKADASEEEKRQAENKAMVIIAKQRNGPIGDVPLIFLKKYTRFETLEDAEHGM